MDVVQSSYIPTADPRLIDQIVYELKSQGIFDQFRKECIADVDTKPAYQNLRQRVEGNVIKFLRQQRWSQDINKNQLREQLRKNISESGYLETGVERIVDQVVNPKINSVFLPKVEDVVYRFLGLQKPNRESKKEIKVTVMDLLPNDLEAVSPESEHDLSSEQKEDAAELNEKSNNSDIKMDEDVSPAFEPLNSPTAYSPRDENSVESHLSCISASRDSINSNMGRSSNQIDTSQNSTESQSSLTFDDNSKMEVCESVEDESTKIAVPNKDDIDGRDAKNISDICEEVEVLMDGKFTKTDEKSKFEVKAISNKERQEEMERKSSSKYRGYKTSSKHSNSSSKDKNKNTSKPKKLREDLKDGKDKDRSKDKEKAKDKSQRDREGKDKESKDKSEKDKSRIYVSSRHKEKSHSSRKDGENQGKTSSTSNKGKKVSIKELESGDKNSLSRSNDSNLKISEGSASDKDKNGKNKNSSSRDKNLSSKEKTKEKMTTKERDTKSKESIKKDKDGSSKSKDILNMEQNRIDKSKSSKDKTSSKDRELGKDKVKDNDTRSTEKIKDKCKESKSTDGKVKNSEKSRKIVKEKSSSGTNHKNSPSKKDKDKKPKDDHYSSKEKKNDRRSTDRDSNDGSGKMGRNSSFAESNSTTYKADSKNSSLFLSSGSGDSSNSDQVEAVSSSSKHVYNKVEPVKYFKPKFASNIREAMHLMKIRKQLAELERTNQLALLTINQSNISSDKPDDKIEGPDDMELNQDIKEVGNEPLLQSTELTKERWEELEARLALEMSNVISSVYEAEGEEDNQVYDTVVVSPKKMHKGSETKHLCSLEDDKNNSFALTDDTSEMVVNIKTISIDGTSVEGKENGGSAKVHISNADDIKDFKENLSSKCDVNSKILFVKIDKIGEASIISDSQLEDHEEMERKILMAAKDFISLSNGHNNGQLLVKNSNEIRKWEDDDSPCLYFKPSIASQKQLQKLNGLITKLEKSIQEESLKIQNNIPRIRRGDRKRKTENITNNNKLNNALNLDVKRRRFNSIEVKKHKLNERQNDGTQDHKFCLPLSPDDSDIDIKKEEPVTVKTKKGYRRTFDNKRYNNEDLYKPRPILTRTRRGQGARNDSS
ncbi:biorientation of chromosomes in cell division protein 1-like 1 isoform X2 [Cylas formicarius]|uniref:biorientation of chromosomes in cell division protein 1-like 1 isoform X2 n=1 Tax=Cylas formicarius TaxID=197179 RepID=UPI0029586A01|nr:biorientation of chromosomes in cell division protein 1-like 1 isoform X2 [Cylas formicarius]